MVKPARRLVQTILAVTPDLASLASSAMRSRAQLSARNLFLRKQLALYQERQVKPRRADDAARVILAPRTVRRYMPSRPPRPKPGTQAWSTFVRSHARSVLGSDFFVVVTATFRLLYVFVVLDVGTRSILHWNVTAHPTAAWTAQQFLMIVSGDQTHRFVIHDRDTIYS